MKNSITNLLISIKELEGKEGLMVSSNLSGFYEEAHSNQNKEPVLFKEIFGYQVPDSFKDGLHLPDTLSVNWKVNAKISGEFSLMNHFLTMHRLLDESFHNLIMKGILLSDMRIVDEVLLHGGPIYILIFVSNENISEKLYLFDTRTLFEMELNYEEYLENLTITKGIVYWQYLFCREMYLSGYEKAVLDQEIKYLQSEFPKGSYEEIRTKWQDKSY